RVIPRAWLQPFLKKSCSADRLQCSLSALAAFDVRGQGEASMRQVDIVIVGGGLAGSTAAAMLGRAGVQTVLVDGHQLYPKDFRCEKLDSSQVLLLRKTGLAEAVTRVATPDLEVWVARFGRVVERKPSAQLDILYDDMVNTIRAEIPPEIEF